MTNVIARTNNLITASRVVPLVDTFIVESSYFVEKTNCTEACVNVEIETVRNFNKTLRFGDLELSTFTNEILRLGYHEDYNKLQNRNNESELINYKRMLFETIHINQYYEEEDINGKVILMGDLEDLKDYHNVPVEIGGRRRISGTIIHEIGRASCRERV